MVNRLLVIELIVKGQIVKGQETVQLSVSANFTTNEEKTDNRGFIE